jgi:hypothetical protein
MSLGEERWLKHGGSILIAKACCQKIIGQGEIMSNVIDFLERMGQDAQLRDASQEKLVLALASSRINPELRAAILAKDQVRLEALLGSINVCCMINPGKEDEDEDTEESPSREGEEMTTQLVPRAMGSAA